MGSHNPLLEGYRRLTPHLRSPAEKALSMRDLKHIGSYFKAWTHTDFCLLSVVPVLFDVVILRRPASRRARMWLQRLDRKLIKLLPFIGRYCWETVIVIER
jgi:hypothetical protein